MDLAPIKNVYLRRGQVRLDERKGSLKVCHCKREHGIYFFRLLTLHPPSSKVLTLFGTGLFLLVCQWQEAEDDEERHECCSTRATQKSNLAGTKLSRKKGDLHSISALPLQRQSNFAVLSNKCAKFSILGNQIYIRNSIGIFGITPPWRGNLV